MNLFFSEFVLVGTKSLILSVCMNSFLKIKLPYKLFFFHSLFILPGSQNAHPFYFLFFFFLFFCFWLQYMYLCFICNLINSVVLFLEEDRKENSGQLYCFITFPLCYPFWTSHPFIFFCYYLLQRRCLQG